MYDTIAENDVVNLAQAITTIVDIGNRYERRDNPRFHPLEPLFDVIIRVFKQIMIKGDKEQISLILGAFIGGKNNYANLCSIAMMESILPSLLWMRDNAKIFNDFTLNAKVILDYLNFEKMIELANNNNIPTEINEREIKRPLLEYMDNLCDTFGGGCNWADYHKPHAQQVAKQHQFNAANWEYPLTLLSKLEI